MKKLLSIVGIFVSASSASAEILYEPFDYTSGATLTTGNAFGLTNRYSGAQWAGAGPTSTTDNIAIGTTNLSLGGLDTGPGLSGTWTANGNSSRIAVGPFGTPGGDGAIPAALQPTNTVYYSVLVRIDDVANLPASTSGAGDNICGLNTLGITQSNNPSVAGAALLARQVATADTTQFVFGFNKNAVNGAAAASWQTDDLAESVGTTYLIVGSYIIPTGKEPNHGGTTNDDTANLWINPDSSTFGQLNPPAPTFTNNTTNDLSTGRIESFLMRQNGPAGTPASGIVVDDIRVGTTWAEVVPGLATVYSADADNTWSGAALPNAAGALVNFAGTTTAQHTITLDTSKTVGSLKFDNVNGYIIAASGASTLTLKGDSSIAVYSGNHSITAPISVVPASELASTIGDLNIAVAQNSTLTLSNDVTFTTGAVLRNTGGGVTQMKNVRADILVLQGYGTMQILSNGTSGGVTVVQSMQMPELTNQSTGGGYQQPSAKLDLTNNGMIVDYSGTSPLNAGSFDAPSIAALIKQGSNGNAWTGNGITSSTAAAVAADGNNPHKTAIGYAEASALGVTSFMGQTVDTTAVLIRYTYLGDANLDGTVNHLDFNALATNYGASGANAAWNTADFNADGVVDSTDFNLLAGNFNLALPAPALGALVPEPGALFLLASTAALAPRRRHRRG